MCNKKPAFYSFKAQCRITIRLSKDNKGAHVHMDIAHSPGCPTQSISFLFLHGMPVGQAVSRFESGISFVVATNLHINLCIKICPPLVGMYCPNCLQQRRPNQNLLFRHISREREPTNPFLCDVKSSFDLFIKPTLNSAEGVYCSDCLQQKQPNQNPLSARISRGRRSYQQGESLNGKTISRRTFQGIMQVT